MEEIRKPLENLRPGETVHYDGADWAVTEKNVYRESEDYREIQWTLSSEERGERYLLRSEEKKGSGVEYVWVFTKQVNIEIIEYESAGAWRPFHERNFVTAPPQKIRFDDTVFGFAGETIGDAKDDEGLTVTKLTWDYYNDAGDRNLAIEVWKEEDRDYPEAYDGAVIDPAKVKVVRSGKARVRAGQTVSQDWMGRLGVFGFFFFLVWTSGVSLDACLAVLVPLALVFAVLSFFRCYWWLYGASACVWLAFGCFAYLTKLSAPVWMAAGYAVAITAVVTKAASLAMPDDQRAACPYIAVSGTLPALWVYSFILYFRFAPRPHTIPQLGITMLLPIVIAAGCFYINRFLGE